MPRDSWDTIEAGTQFTLPPEAFDPFPSLLAHLGIRVRDEDREMEEELPTGAIQYDSYTGVLLFKDCEFPYFRMKDPPNFGFWVAHKNSDPLVFEDLLETLNRIFPQRKKPRARWQKLGCIGMAIIILTIFALATYGIHELIKLL